VAINFSSRPLLGWVEVMNDQQFKPLKFPGMPEPPAVGFPLFRLNGYEWRIYQPRRPALSRKAQVNHELHELHEKRGSSRDSRAGGPLLRSGASEGAPAFGVRDGATRSHRFGCAAGTGARVRLGRRVPPESGDVTPFRRRTPGAGASRPPFSELVRTCPASHPRVREESGKSVMSDPLFPQENGCMSAHPTVARCPKCGAPVPDSAAEGLCTRCLLAAAAAPTRLANLPVPGRPRRLWNGWPPRFPSSRSSS